MIKNMLPTLRCVCWLLIMICPAFADDFDVDNADSLDFERFHEDKKTSVTTRNNDSKLPEATHSAPQAEHSSEPSASTSISTTAAGTRFEVRERYSLQRSNHTRYNALNVIEALHKQMAELCPNGWNKLREWSQPIENDFYLHYELQCR